MNDALLQNTPLTATWFSDSVMTSGGSVHKTGSIEDKKSRASNYPTHHYHNLPALEGKDKSNCKGSERNVITPNLRAHNFPFIIGTGIHKREANS